MTEPTAFDVAIRHQAYLEGVKEYEQDAADPLGEALTLMLAALLVKWGYESLDKMPKRVLAEFIAAFNEKANKLIKAFYLSFMKELKGVVKVNALVTSLNYSFLSGKPAASPKSSYMWRKITNDVIPGTGHLPGNLLKDYLRSVRNQIVALIRRGYSEKWDTKRIIKELNGSRARNFKDGLMHRMLNQFHTVSNTLIQHAHGWLSFHFGGLFFEFYQWLSVLDSSTTTICRHRHGKIFSYANGPRPPAHYNCRSSIVGLPRVENLPTLPADFYDWLSLQPREVQIDMIGAAKAGTLRAGNLPRKDLPRFDGVRKLTPEQFGKRQPRMIMKG